MVDDQFGKLSDVEPRRAWKHEAHNFTPWLAATLERLGDEIGIALELIKAEASLPVPDATTLWATLK